MLIADLSITDAIPVLAAALTAFLVVQGFGLLNEDRLERADYKIDESE